MCIINFHYKHHPIYRLIVIANRDEFYDRPTAPAHFWEEDPEILAGKDLQAQGTWLGVTKTGRFAALTNIRDFTNKQREYPTTRGDIVANFLRGKDSPINYLKKLVKIANEYAGFNLIVGDKTGLFYVNNYEKKIMKIEPGTHSLSNHFLNSPWPKVRRGREKLKKYVMKNNLIDNDKLFSIGLDNKLAPDHELPSTGISLELERKLSPLFIKTENYGTRSITVLTIDQNNKVKFTERTFEKGEFATEKEFSFII